MDFFADLFVRLHELAAGAETWQQIGVLLLAGAVPFVESYLGSFLGVLVGVPPVVAVLAASVGNIASTFAVIAVTSRVRRAATGRRGGVSRSDTEHEGVGRSGAAAGEPGTQEWGASGSSTTVAAQPDSKRRKKIARYVDRFGVAGACLLGPIVVASQITAPALIAIGARPRTVYVFQAIAIVAWGVLFGFFGEFALRWFG